jgi:putative ABC transport system permease protein
MLKNYLKIAFRSLLKQKVYSAINILGLSVGIASCLLIVLYVTNQLSYDQFHAKKDLIYKMALERKYPNHSTNYAIIPHSFADVIVQDFPEVASTVRMGGPFNDVQVRYTTPKNEIVEFEEDFIMAADSNVFNVFSIKLLKGEPNKMLNNINQIVVTESAAKRYFGNDEPVGKVLRMFGQDFNVSGVCQDIPDNSHFKFDLLTKWDEQFFGGRAVNFTSFSAHTYIEMKPGTNAKDLEAKFPAMVNKYAAAQIERELGKSWADYQKEGNGYRYFLQPLTEIHLDPTNIEAKMKPGGNRLYVYFLIAIAVLIIVIACINFMNLATARSAERAREVGVRKTMGSLRAQLISQFLTESVILALLSTVVAVGIVTAVLPAFNNLIQGTLQISYDGVLIIGLLAVALIVGLLAGSYPAFALSGFNPVVIMKGNFTGNSKGAWLRNGLVVFQFFISIVLIIGTLVVANQMEYMQNKSLGYNADQVLVVQRAFGLQQQRQAFIDEIEKMPGVERASNAFSLLGQQRDFFGAFYLPEGSTEVLTVKTMVIDDTFAETIGFEFAEGKGFAQDVMDSLSLLLNETAIKTMGIHDPIGKTVSLVQRTPNGTVNIPFKIIGVVKDFNFQTLRDPVTPLAIRNTESFGGGGGQYIYVRVKGDKLTETVASVEKQWKTMVPDQPFKYQFLDENLNAQYASEKTAGEIFGIFSGLAIFIACVGLFGLAAYTANSRTKEIGIRKVMGASVANVVMLLSRDFAKLILFAFILAVPLSWYIMDNWLNGFAYHVELGIEVFLFAGITTLVIAWLTVSYQSIRAAIVNPVKSLRSE